MRERGIIFNAEMVRAVLDGRKTQTRRIIKNQRVGDKWSVQPAKNPRIPGHTHDWWLPTATKPYSALPRCPYGAVGDRLWVRETWQCTSFETNEYGHVEGVDYMREIPKQKPQSPAWGVSYEANGFDTDNAEERGFPWRPSIHMPRWASRITLEIAGVRVERLDGISNADAISEGVGVEYGWDETKDVVPRDARRRFAELWQSIYGDESWQANPWVWVIEFKRVEGDV